jgi:hypothetical protein
MSWALASAIRLQRGLSLRVRANPGGNGWLRKQVLQYWDCGQDTDCQERPTRRSPLIFIEPIRQEQTDPNAKGNPSSSN